MVVYPHRRHHLHHMHHPDLTCQSPSLSSYRSWLQHASMALGAQTQTPMSYCSWSILWKGRNHEGQLSINRLMHCSGVNFCVGVRESTVIQFSNARTYDATCAFVRVLTDWVRGDVNILIQPATDAEVAMASAAAATAQADTVAAGIESRDTPPPAGDGTRLPLKVHALLGLAARDPEDVLPAPSEASRLDRGGKFGTVFASTSRDTALRRNCASLMQKATTMIGKGFLLQPPFRPRTMCCAC